MVRCGCCAVSIRDAKRFATVVGDHVGEVGSGGSAHSRDEVLVGGHREAGVGVSESFGHDLDRRACSDKQTGVSVAQIVKANAGDVGASKLPVEELADRLGVHRVPCVLVKIGSATPTR